MTVLRYRPALALIALGLLIAGCSTNSRPPASLERAAALSARGDHAAAAREYEALSAQARGTALNPVLISAAKEWLRANDAGAAEAAIARLVTPLESDQPSMRSLLLAEAALLRGEASRGWELLSSVGTPVGAARIDEYHALRQRLALATNRPLQAIRSQADRETVAKDAAATQKMRQDFLLELVAAVDRGITLDPRVAGRDAAARGWLEAAPLAARVARAPKESNAGITAAWRQRHPNHPATAALASLGQSPSTSASPDSSSIATDSAASPRIPTATSSLLPLGRSMPRVAHVAVLLPLSGRNGALGAQIREGILAAYFSEPESMRTPLRFYDTARQSVAEAFAAAMQGGAVSVIGPLARDEVLAVITSATVAEAPTVIALNALPAGQTAPPNVRQFALSPEDEARAVARRALAEGRRRAVALVPSGDWGARVLQAFREELDAGGGTLLGAETLPGRDLGNAAQSLLRIDSSIARHRRLQSVLDMPLAFQPRRRADVDFIFMPGTAATLRQWRPQLRFQGLGDLPAYATSDAFDGRVGDELQGLVFPDIDWMIAPQAPLVATLRANIQDALADSAQRNRFFALGHDAWMLHVALRSGRSPSIAAPMTGAVGSLFVDDEGRVQRSLRFAKFDDGQIKLLDALDGGG
jgi:outer membrane PBP1 activator LpoA protein